MSERVFEVGEGWVTSADVARMASAVRTLGAVGTDRVELIEQISRLEELKSSIAAAQA